jgi:glycerol-3-phosphate O-acyltransferase / dihydroxyacetone phosphate acyltransferase
VSVRQSTRLVRWLAHVVCRIFYRIEYAGDVPATGAVLLLANHPNALLDPAIVWATAGRDVRFLAKSTLFSGAFGVVLNAAGAIPVYRRLDEGVDTSKNAEMFKAVYSALANGQAICIFPEGISHSEGRLVPLRTGAARMALSAERDGTPVQLVAVGLNFLRKTAFRSRVTVLYGRPFSVSDLAGQANERTEERDASGVRLATERIAAHMRRLLVESDPEKDAAIVGRVERLYAAARGPAADPRERVARRQAIAAGIERLREADPARYSELAMRLDRYDQRLRRFRLRDRHLDWDLSAATALRFVAREGTIGLAVLPLAAAALALFWVPYQVTGVIARRATATRDVAATAKVFVGAAVYAAWLAIVSIAIWQTLSASTAVLAAVSLPFVAYAGLFALERESAVVDTARSWLVLSRARHRSRDRLRHERSEIARVLDETYQWLSEGTSGPAAAQRPN